MAADARRDVVVGAVGDEEHGAQRRVVLTGERLERTRRTTGPAAWTTTTATTGGAATGARSLSTFAVHGGLRLPVPA